MNRISWDRYFADLALVVSKRSTCPRLAVGAVLVRDRQVLATGYNGAARTAPHCTDVGCVIHEGHCIAAVHAETNAILQAAKSGVSTANSTMYITVNPCLTCFKMMYQAGVNRIVYISDIPAHLYKPIDYGVFKIDDNCMPELKCIGSTDSNDPNGNNY